MRLLHRLAIGDARAGLRSSWRRRLPRTRAAPGPRPAPTPRLLGEIDRSLRPRRRPRAARRWKSSSVMQSGRLEPRRERDDRPVLAPLLDLRLVAIQLRIEHRVRAEPIGAELEQRRPAAGARMLGRVARRLPRRRTRPCRPRRLRARRRPRPWPGCRSATPSARAPCPSRRGCSRRGTAPAAATAPRGSCDSWNSPSAAAPSPKKQAATPRLPRIFSASAEADRERQAAADDRVAAVEARARRRRRASSRRARRCSRCACRTARP